MDPFAHTFTGAALAASGLRRVTPLATAALIVGANAADIDIVSLLGGNTSALAFRRGWTHGLLAVVVLPLLLAGALLLWDRCVRRRYRPGARPARAGPLLAVTAVGVATHPLLDWLNNYGMRWLMPFDGAWNYGDALFIIDPWVWLALGGAACLAWSARPALMVIWAGFWLFASYLILTSSLVSTTAAAIWLAALGAMIGARTVGFAGPAGAASSEWTARAALALVALYAAVNVVANFPARAAVHAELAARGIAPVGRVMIGPVPANPFAGTVVVEAGERYYRGSWHWLATPRFVLEPRPMQSALTGPVFEAATRSRPVRQFLVWSRFPYMEVDAGPGGYTVRFGDARYVGTGSGFVRGPTARLDDDLRLLGPADIDH